MNKFFCCALRIAVLHGLPQHTAVTVCAGHIRPYLAFMDARVYKQCRNSRWTRDPVVDDGRAVVAYPTERDIEIFRLLARYRYLTSDYIYAFVGGNPKALSRRLNLLSRKPNLYLARPHQQRESASANHRPLIYELDERAIRLLRELGASPPPKSYHRNFAHELMTTQIMASFELGTKEHSHVRLITWSEILSKEHTPLLTRESSSPATIPVTFSMRGEAHSLKVTADAQPFGLERVIGGNRSYLFFPGIETDCATEPLDASDADRSSLAKKFAGYTAIAEQGIYRSHFGFPNFFVPIITSSLARMHSMMRLLEKMTDGHGSKMFLFKMFPTFTSFDPPPKAGGHMLSEPWLRVGYPPLLLLS
jgi:hypothetical protein